MPTTFIDAQTRAVLDRFFGYELVQIMITVVITLVAQVILKRIVSRLVKQTVRHRRHTSKFEEEKREKTLSSVFQTAISIVLWVIALFTILGELHLPLGSLLTGAGAVSVVIGFGAQNLIKDFLAGVFIVLENQYGIGDIITLTTTGGVKVSGTVEDFTLRVTKLRDLDGNAHYITNGASGVISSSTNRYANVNLNIHLSYQTDFEKVEILVNRVGQEVAEDPDFSKSIIEPIQFLRVENFDEYAVAIKVFGKVRPGEQYRVAGEFRRRLLEAFQEHKIHVPLAQVVTPNK